MPASKAEQVLDALKALLQTVPGRAKMLLGFLAKHLGWVGESHTEGSSK